MYILGMKNAGYDTSCALMKDGKIVCAICEERLSREKRTKKFPINALKYCLAYEGITLKDVDHVAIAWNPGINLERMNAGQSEKHRYIPEFLYSVPNYLIANMGASPTAIRQEINFEGSTITIHYLEHHLCHAASAYYTSDFNNAMIFSVDAWGEKVSTLMARADGREIKKVWEIEFPQSLGMFYETLTQYLGFTPQNDEWKVMGASSYGDKDKFKDKIYKLIWPTLDGKFEMDLSYFDYMSFTKRYLFSPKMAELIGPAFRKDDEMDERRYDIAAAAQHVFEEICFSILNKHFDVHTQNLCLGGGCAMNCVANGRVARNTGFKKINIGFAPDDAGSSIGACFFLWNNYLNHANERDVFMSPYLSKEVGPDEIKATLDNYKVRYRVIENPAKVAAEYISQGRIVGWFQGRMEFGQRALGNRSILADPRRSDMKDLINKAVKYREAFRPFAPAILDECGQEYFEHYEFVPYMEKVLDFKEDKKAVVPAVCHADGTGRLQSVSKKMNPLFWQLIDEFRKVTGVPIVLNTSFNLNGEPIVHSVTDAIRTFYSCGMDVLIAGRYLVEK